ncbi:hypothetical protein [Candidatus Symbiopectobacterium sp.]|uniref:hypothetical protein n=1 Tax=Candidatus Symbiopectobacterium sp. TaxID=2816440 RepID=UPI0025C1B463|nr:hypothetical protein [Candidatus Symbiopectobacterium sp.]
MNVKNPLFLPATRRYASTTSTKVDVGFSSTETRADDRYFSLRFFYVRQYHSCAQIMVGRNGGAHALAGFSCAGLLTLLRLTTLFSSGVVRLQNLTREAAAMVATPPRALPETPSLDCYRRLHRARETTRWLFLDLHTRPPNGLNQYYLPFVFS